MHRIMAELHQDHIHLSRLLVMLDRHVKVLSNDGDPDLCMMIDIVDYIKNYSDLFHHPQEDKVYEVFKTRSNQAADIVEILLNEHQHMPEVTIGFQQLLEDALNKSIIVSKQELSDQITQFINIQRKHLNTEEEKLFPLINNTLQKNDWARLEELVQKRTDPLFGEQVEECYEDLHQTIKGKLE